MSAVSDGTPRSARREATRRRLLDAASGAFAERGFHGTSVEDVCERAGFTRGAFYSNFASRDDLLVELVRERSARIHARLRDLTSRDDMTPRELLHAVLGLWQEEPGERQQWLLLQSELMLHAIRDPEGGTAWRQLVDESRRAITEALDEYLRRRGMRLPITSEGLARLLLATFQGGALQHLLAPDQVGPDELEEQLVSVLEKALDEA